MEATFPYCSTRIGKNSSSARRPSTILDLSRVAQKASNSRRANLVTVARPVLNGFICAAVGIHTPKGRGDLSEQTSRLITTATGKNTVNSHPVIRETLQRDFQLNRIRRIKNAHRDFLSHRISNRSPRGCRRVTETWGQFISTVRKEPVAHLDRHLHRIRPAVTKRIMRPLSKLIKIKIRGEHCRIRGRLVMNNAQRINRNRSLTRKHGRIRTHHIHMRLHRHLRELLNRRLMSLTILTLNQRSGKIPRDRGSPLRNRITIRIHEHRLIRTQNGTLRRRIELRRHFHTQKRPNSPISNRHDSLRHPGPAQRRLRRRTIWQDRNRAPTQAMRHTLQPPPSIKISASHNLIRQIQNELLHRLRSPTRNSHTSSSPPTVTIPNHSRISRRKITNNRLRSIIHHHSQERNTILQRRRMSLSRLHRQPVSRPNSINTKIISRTARNNKPIQINTSFKRRNRLLRPPNHRLHILQLRRNSNTQMTRSLLSINIPRPTQINIRLSGQSIQQLVQNIVLRNSQSGNANRSNHTNTSLPLGLSALGLRANFSAPNHAQVTAIIGVKSESKNLRDHFQPPASPMLCRFAPIRELVSCSCPMCVTEPSTVTAS